MIRAWLGSRNEFGWTPRQRLVHRLSELRFRWLWWRGGRRITAAIVRHYLDGGVVPTELATRLSKSLNEVCDRVELRARHGLPPIPSHWQ